MNLFKTKISIKLACLTVLLAGIFTFSKAQGPSSIGFDIASCYHVLQPNNQDVTYNVLNLGLFHFNFSNNMGAVPDRIRVETYDENGSPIPFDYQYSGLSDDKFPEIYHPDYAHLASTYAYDIETNKFIFNQNMFEFNANVKSVVITGFHWTGEPGEEVLEANNYNIKMNFLSVDEAFDFHSNNGECLTFDNFNLGYTTNLDGFCNNIYDPILSVIGPPSALMHFNSNVSIPVDFNQNKILSLPSGQDFNGWCTETCTNVSAPHTAPEPVGCGCINFKVKFTLKPCPHANADCPEINMEKTISICCFCDVRTIGPSN